MLVALCVLLSPSACFRIDPLEVSEEHEELVKLPGTGEPETPKAEWIFYSGWETATGVTEEAITDGGRWADYKYDPNLSVVTKPSPCGLGGNVLRIQWDKYGAADCSDGSNNFVELFPQLPNPFYLRVYFYSEDPREYSGCGGRKFFHIKEGSAGLYLYDAGGNNVRLHAKNFAVPDTNGYNTRSAKHLDGSKNWPGQESKGIVRPNRWYCIEFAHYRHNTNGWIKAWLNGKLVINASKEAWRAKRYDTDDGQTTWIQMPSFRNGGTMTDHTEYLDGFVISRSYIGLAK